MREKRRLLWLLAGLSLTVVLAAVAVAGEPMNSALTLKAIEVGLQRSPEHFVAGVLEVVGIPKCEDPKDKSTCVNDAKLVEVLASGGGKFEQGDVLTFSGAGPMGQRYLAFLVPVDGRPGIYGATVLSLGAGEEDRTVFIDDLEKAGCR